MRNKLVKYDADRGQDDDGCHRPRHVEVGGVVDHEIAQTPICADKFANHRADHSGCNAYPQPIEDKGNGVGNLNSTQLLQPGRPGDRPQFKHVVRSFKKAGGCRYHDWKERDQHDNDQPRDHAGAEDDDNDWCDCDDRNGMAENNQRIDRLGHKPIRGNHRAERDSEDRREHEANEDRFQRRDGMNSIEPGQRVALCTGCAPTL